MKTHRFTLLMLTIFAFMCILPVTAQVSATNNQHVGIRPLPPTPQDSIHVVYHYVSTDGCPDFYLELDSVVANKQFVGIKPIIDSSRFCTLAITRFTTAINLGLLEAGTEIFVNERRIAIIRYMDVEPKETYTLAGLATAGTDTVQSGRALLIRKDVRRLWATTQIVNGKFVFANTPAGTYTVQVFPDRMWYRGYVPTFYVDKLLMKDADFFELAEDISGLTVKLLTIQERQGHGRIRGKVSYESESLRDSVLSAYKSHADKVADNVTVYLMNRENRPVSWTVTDAQGNYSFDNMALQGYRIVAETAKAEAEYDVTLSMERSTADADLILRSPSVTTDLRESIVLSLQVYPNPVTDILNVTAAHAAELQVFNAMGQLMLRHSLTPGLNQIPASHLPEGMLIINSGNQIIKLMKD